MKDSRRESVRSPAEADEIVVAIWQGKEFRRWIVSYSGRHEQPHPFRVTTTRVAVRMQRASSQRSTGRAILGAHFVADYPTRSRKSGKPRPARPARQLTCDEVRGHGGAVERIASIGLAPLTYAGPHSGRVPTEEFIRRLQERENWRLPRLSQLHVCLPEADHRPTSDRPPYFHRA
jgi:hypothetical protein